MIEVRKADEPKTETGKTPERITTTMILNDLDNGIDRTGIQEKYGLEKWEVTQMFQHPTLKGKKAKKVRKLSFEFVDDSAAQVDPNQTSIVEQSEHAENFHNTADLRTKEAILNDSKNEELIDSFDEVEEDEDDNEFEY